MEREWNVDGTMIPFERNGGHERWDPRRQRASLDARLGGRMGSLAALEQVGKARRKTGNARATWLLPPLLLAAIGAGLLFVMRGPDELFGLAFGAVLGLGLLWVLVSALFPGKADRLCPQCARDGLARIDPQSTQGLYCRHCSWRDESASAFLHAEDEGWPLEDIILKERNGERPPRRP